MTEKTTLQVTDSEIGGMRHNLNLLRAQIQSGRSSRTSSTSRSSRMIDLLERLELEHHQLKKQGQLRSALQRQPPARFLAGLADRAQSGHGRDHPADQSRARLPDAARRRRAGGRQSRAQLRPADPEQRQVQVQPHDQPIRCWTPASRSSPPTPPKTRAMPSRTASSVKALRSIMATPLRVRGQVIGLIYVDNSAITGLFEDDDLATLDAFAGQAAIAIDNAQLFSATDQKLDRARRGTAPASPHRPAVERNARRGSAMSYTLEWAARLAGAEVGYFGVVDGKSHPDGATATASNWTTRCRSSSKRPIPQALEVVEDGRNGADQRRAAQSRRADRPGAARAESLRRDHPAAAAARSATSRRKWSSASSRALPSPSKTRASTRRCRPPTAPRANSSASSPTISKCR